MMHAPAPHHPTHTEDERKGHRLRQGRMEFATEHLAQPRQSGRIAPQPEEIGHPQLII